MLSLSVMITCIFFFSLHLLTTDSRVKVKVKTNHQNTGRKK